MGRKPEGFKPPSQSRGSRRREQCPAALQYSSKTQGDSWGLLRSHEDNKLEPNPLSLFGLGAKVAHRHHLTKREGSGSTPAASITITSLLSISYGGRGNLSRVRLLMSCAVAGLAP